MARTRASLVRPVARKAARTGTRNVGRAVAQGSFDQYLVDIQRLPMITDPAEERALARRALSGDQTAAERLVTANLRFVIAYVKKYQGHGLDLGELVAIGNEGLLKAVRKFDPDHGVKFISYAVWWVRQAVLKALAEQTRSVRIPLNQNSSLIKMSRVQALLAQELGRAPTDGELARALGEQIETIREARQMSTIEMSLDAPVDGRDRHGATVGERVAGNSDSEIESLTDQHLTREFVDRLFRLHLTPRERAILSMYYGLEEGSEALTLEAIGERLGVTRERIRQIRERAFEKLRHCPDMLYLSGQLGDSAGKIVPGGIEAETRRTLENIKAALERNGSSLDNVVKCTAMLADMREWPAMNAVYATYFTKHFPARSAFGTNGLALGARMELECMATVDTPL